MVMYLYLLNDCTVPYCTVFENIQIYKTCEMTKLFYLQISSISCHNHHKGRAHATTADGQPR